VGFVKELLQVTFHQQPSPVAPSHGTSLLRANRMSRVTSKLMTAAHWKEEISHHMTDQQSVSCAANTPVSVFMMS
jgi:hypothetical protein